MSDIFQRSDKTMEMNAYRKDKSKFHERSQALKDTLAGKSGVTRDALASFYRK